MKIASMYNVFFGKRLRVNSSVCEYFCAVKVFSEKKTVQKYL